jgi:hypothetical protein
MSLFLGPVKEEQCYHALTPGGACEVSQNETAMPLSDGAEVFASIIAPICMTVARVSVFVLPYSYDNHDDRPVATA